MEQKHRNAIQNCFTSLVNQTDLDLMVSALYEKGVFSEAMIEPYRDTTKDPRTRRRQLYRDITRRGPHAFQHLVDALSENGYWNIVRELDPDSPLHPSSRPPPRPNPVSPGSFLSIADQKRITGKEQDDPNRPKQLQPERPQENPKPQEPKEYPEAGGSGDHNDNAPTFKVVKSTRFIEDHGNDIKLYPTRGRRRGLMVVFSYIQFQNDIEEFRAGALVDVRNLQQVFTDIGFKVLCYNDLSRKGTVEALEYLQTAPGLAERPEAVFVVFSSHGYARAGSGDADLRTADGQLISYYDIIDHFNNQRCPALRGTPKVFIFQTCRGPNKDFISAPPPRHMRAPTPRARPDAGQGGGGGGGGGGGTVGTALDGSVYRDDDAPADDDAKARDRMYSDILIAHSTLPGYVSKRDRVHGSWYIQALCAVFAARAHDCHVEKLFTLVDERLRTRFNTQTSSVDRWGFNRRLYLHPGLFQD